MEACAEDGRYEFMLVVAPLKMKGQRRLASQSDRHPLRPGF